MTPTDPSSDPRPGFFQRLAHWLRQDVWHVELGGVPTFKRWWTRSVRVVLIAARGFVRDQCTRHAMALTYITIFALPPFLAFVFSLAKSVGAYKNLKARTIDPFLDANFGTDDGGQVRQAIDQIFRYVEDTNLGSVAAIGLLVILFAVFKLLGAVEFTLNDIWGIRRPRKLVRRITDYLAIVTVTPVLLVTGAGLTAYMDGRVGEWMRDSREAVVEAPSEGVEDEVRPAPAEVVVDPPGESGGSGRGRSPFLRLVSILTIVLGMGFVIFTLPNTSVRIWPALFGGLVSGLLWQVLQFGSVYLQVWLAGQNAIYSSLAAIPMLMIWIYLSWTILLVGAETACAVQTEPVVASVTRTGRVDQRLREVLAPRLAARITRAFLDGAPPPTGEGMAQELGLAPRAIREVLERLVAAGLLARTEVGEDLEGYLPGRDPASIHLQDLLQALKHEEGGRTPEPSGALDLAVDRARMALESEAVRSPANLTLRQLAEGREGDEPPMAEAGDTA